MKKKKNLSRRMPLSTDDNKMIFIAKEFTESSYDCVGDIIKLRHPRTGHAALFLLQPDGIIQEILTHAQNNRSWFIGNSVWNGNKVRFCTPLDTLFLILPYICKCKVNQPLDQLLQDEEFEHAEKLEKISESADLNIIADKSAYGDTDVWKYNEGKTLSWLEKKVARACEVLKSKRLNVQPACAMSENFVKSGKEEENEEHYLRFAFGIVADYLPKEVSDALAAHLKVPSEEESGGGKRKRSTDENDRDKLKQMRRENFEKDILATAATAVPMAKKPPAKNAKKEALAKAAVGTKSISSFFTKTKK